MNQGSGFVLTHMARDSYMPVYPPRAVRFREMVFRRGMPVQRVLVVGPDGVPVVAHYPMERQTGGLWRIAGCVLTPIETDPI